MGAGGGNQALKTISQIEITVFQVQECELDHESRLHFVAERDYRSAPYQIFSLCNDLFITRKSLP